MAPKWVASIPIIVLSGLCCIFVIGVAGKSSEPDMYTKRACLGLTRFQSVWLCRQRCDRRPRRSERRWTAKKRLGRMQCDGDVDGTFAAAWDVDGSVRGGDCSEICFVDGRGGGVDFRCVSHWLVQICNSERRHHRSLLPFLSS